MISTSLVVDQCDGEPRTFASPIRPLDMHWWIIISHNSVTKIKEKLTLSKIGTRIAFARDPSSYITICQCTLLAMHELPPSLRPNPISIWWSAWDAICRGNSLQAEQAVISWSGTNPALQLAEETQCICVTRVSGNLVSYDCVMV